MRYCFTVHMYVCLQLFKAPVQKGEPFSALMSLCHHYQLHVWEMSPSISGLFLFPTDWMQLRSTTFQVMLIVRLEMIVACSSNTWRLWLTAGLWAL